MEELLIEAFKLGQQWVKDINNEKEPESFTEWFNKREEAINYTRCSTQLPSKDEITFDEYLKLKKIEHTERGVYKWEGSLYNDTYIKKCYEIYKM